eukprot:CAMPEP_0168442816 /NCGR_PEP_ID=MMETSP0228-20121227/44210_1 /TAXON_ID=133427 /ORGANISM="Protoceratium reticulatum, Strain CCCM 535 (=CCMP 1889)" /LENGTH=121 /DNA_ID=CAMNT_0008457203 /DNA_START=17 /DNA_END=378 /DNA_ORIENTATION=-
MAPKASSLSSAALLSASLCSPAAAFVAAPSAAGAPVLRVSGIGHSLEAAASDSWQASGKVDAGLAGNAAPAAACAVAAVAGAASLARRRRATATRVLERPIQVIEWQVDPKDPIPGSEKAL